MFVADKRRKRLRSSLSSTFNDSNETASNFSSTSSSLRRRLSSDWVETTTKGTDNATVAAALKGVVVCVTGLSPESKTRCHELVEQLGGSFTRHLDSSQNTHLIAQTPDGPKYEAAVSCPNVLVVKPSWLEACYQTKCRVLETEHTLEPLNETIPEKKDPTTENLSLSTELNKLLPTASGDCRVFSSCMFLLIGFDENSQERLHVGQLIRKGWGTIYWEMNDSISHLVVADGCGESVKVAIRTVALQHPNRITVVSPWWTLASFQARRLVAPEAHPPRASTQSQPKLVSKSKLQTKKKTLRKASALFRGCLFVLLRMAPPDHAVDFEGSVLEEAIRLNGGQMLSLKLVEALRADARKQNLELRHCYVVCWGGYHATTQMSIHPLLAQVKRFQLADTLQVTPIWLQTCISDQRKYAPHSLPQLFQPQAWPLRRLRCPKSDAEEKEKKITNEIRISITGFLTPDRTALMQVILAMGAIYDDTMRTTTTHLICKEFVGTKFEKAVQWGLHVLSVDWLYHVAQYGYHGQEKCESGCEHRFELPKRAGFTENSDCEGDDSQQEVAGTQEV